MKSCNSLYTQGSECESINSSGSVHREGNGLLLLHLFIEFHLPYRSANYVCECSDIRSAIKINN